MEMVGDIQLLAKINQDGKSSYSRNVEIKRDWFVLAADRLPKQLLLVTTDDEYYVTIISH